MRIDSTDLPSELRPLSCSPRRAAGVAFTSDGLQILLLPRLFQPNVCGCCHQGLCETELSQFFDRLIITDDGQRWLTAQKLD